MQMKGIRLLFLSVIFLLLGGHEVKAQEYLTSGDYQYTYDAAEDSVCIRKYTGTAKTVIVPAQIDGKPVRYMGEVFYNNTHIQKAVLPEGIRVVCGFDGCSNLKKVNIPKSCDQIDSFAFARCSKLEKIMLPGKLKEIGDFAFYKCTTLQTIRMPDSVTSLGQAAFRGCKKLKNVRLSQKLTAIECQTFMGCRSLGRIEIPKCAKMIDDMAFEGCSSLKTVTLPKSLVEIRDMAFEESGLKTIVIPQNVRYIGTNVFASCNKLKKVTIKSTKIKSMGTQPFYGIHNDAVFDVPNQLIRKYEKLIGYVTETKHVFQ